jgi:hypothetical protein
MKYIQPKLLLWLLFVSSGCGNAEAIKSYSYPTTKYNLEKAVLKVIKSNPRITIDTTESKVIVRRNPNDMNDTTTKAIKLSEFHGHSKDSAAMAADDKAVIKIKIKVGDTDNDYIFRYSGYEQDWKSSKSSAIFIQNVTDKHGNSISQGHNEHGEFNSKKAKDFTDLFETEVVNKIDQVLKLKHTID